MPEAARKLAEVFLEMGDLGEAERHALHGVETVGADDWVSVATTRMALGRVRDAQGRDEEAETLLRDAVATVERTDYRALYWEEYLAVAEFCLRRGRTAEGSEWLGRARQSAALLSPATPVLGLIERRAAAARRGQRAIDETRVAGGRRTTAGGRPADR
jgi:ATP/maltotriose-dependent transcriptional regulator MalT